MTTIIRRSIWATALLTKIFCGVVAEATTYYVKPSGNDANAGTSEQQAWKTLYKACTAPEISAGDVILIRSGTYAEGNNFNIGPGFNFIMQPKSGQQGNPIVYKGYPGDARPIIRGSLGAEVISGATVYGRSHVVFDSLIFTNCYLYGVHTESGFDIGIRNCVFDSIGITDQGGNNPAAIGQGVGRTAQLRVENCEFTNGNGVHLYGVDSAVIMGSTFSNTSEGVNLKISTSGRRAANVHIYGNTVIKPVGARWGANAFNVQGSYVARDIYIHHNVVYGNWDKVFRMSNTDVYVDTGRHDRIYFYNNTVHWDNMGGGFAGIETTDTLLANTTERLKYLMDTVQIFNNIVVTPEVGTSTSVFQQAGTMTYVGGGTVPAVGRLGHGFLWDYNAIIDTLRSGGYMFGWCEAAPTGSGWAAGTCRWWTWQEFRDSLPLYGSGYLGHGLHDTLMISFSNMFLNLATRNYRLSSNAPQVLKTGGRGGVWPSYMGAFAPNDTIPPPPDVTPPTISDVRVTGLGGCEGTLSWQTDEWASSVVAYGEGAVLADTQVNSGFATSHRVVLRGLFSNTTYQFSIRCRDLSGNESSNTGGAFATTSETCNLAEGAGVTVSASYPGYSPVAITDGIIDPYGQEATTWASDDGTQTADWIEIDLGTATSVQSVRIHWAWNPFQSEWMTSQQYTIQYWNGVSYDTLANVSNSTVSTVTQTSFPPTLVQRIRIHQAGSGGPAAYPEILWVTEVQVFGGTSDTVPPAAIVNLR